jgi:hypothetical protein
MYMRICMIYVMFIYIQNILQNILNMYAYANKYIYIHGDIYNYMSWSSLVRAVGKLHTTCLGRLHSRRSQGLT